MIRNDEAFIGGQIPGGGGGRRSSKPERLTSQPQKFDLLQLKKPVFEQVQGSPERDPYGAAALGLSKDIAEYLHEKAEDYRNVRRNEELADLQNGSQIYAQDFLSKSESGIGLTKAVLEDFDKRLDKSIVDYEDDEKDKIRLRASGLRKSISKACMLREIDALEKFNIKSGENTRFSLLNNLYVSPEQEPELRKVYDASVDVNKGKIRAVLFDKFKDEKTAAWNKTYAQALINSNPFDYENILKRNEFKALDQASYQQLWNYGSSVAHKAERAILLQKEELRKEENRRQDKLIKRTVDDIEEHPNKYTMKDIDGFAKEYGFDENHRYDLRHKFRKAMEKYDKNAEEEDKIKDSIAKGTPIPDVSTEQKNKYFYKKHIKELNEKRAAEGKPKLSLSEIVKEANEYAVTFSGMSDSLKSAVVTSVMNSNNPETILEGCRAANISAPMIKDLDKEVTDFACLARAYFTNQKEGSKELTSLRNEYFKPIDSNTREYRGKLWKESDYNKKPVEAIDKFYRNNGFETWLGRRSWLPGGEYINPASKTLLDAEVLGTVKRVYERTGSFSKAEAVANELIGKKIKKTNINGRSGEYMINPPTPENTGFSERQITKVINSCIHSALVDLNKAGEEIEILAVPGMAKFSINGKKQARKIYYEGIYSEDGDDKEARGNLYYLLDPDDLQSREYLINPAAGQRVVVDFGRLREIYQKIAKKQGLRNE